MSKIVSYKLLFAFYSMGGVVSCVLYHGSEQFPHCCTIPFLFYNAYIDTKRRKKIQVQSCRIQYKDSSLTISFPVNVFRSMNICLVVLSLVPSCKELKPQSLQCCVDKSSDRNTSIQANITASPCPYMAVKCFNER